jgi:hypothetical protein
LFSPVLGVPLVLGWLRPAIYFPASLLLRLSVAEVEALMLHELAHLTRRDPLLLFWVTVVETLFFHNPAAHALARTTRQTAELACDDLVLMWQGDGRTYANALAAAEEWRGAQLALAATGAGSLKHRIQRILGMGEHGRLTTLQQRFGITSVAGIALYLIIFGVAVPQLAKALTPGERVALIAKERKLLKVTSANENTRDLVGEGIVRTADGSRPSQEMKVTGWSFQYTASASGIEAGKKFTVAGRGDEMTAAAWVDGYAPALTRSSRRDSTTDRVSFELVLERGTPMRALVMDEAGNPIPNAQVHCAAIITPERKLQLQNKFISDGAGTVQIGNAQDGRYFEFEVYAHGWQWQMFEGMRFQQDKPIRLTLRRANPIIGVVLDAQTRQPVAGANATCFERSGRMSDTSYSYGYNCSPDVRMNSHPSDASGRLTLDTCHADERYEVLIEAPGYARQKVSLTGLSTSFQASLQPELVLSGVIEDPENTLADADGTVTLNLWTEITPSVQSIDVSKTFKSDGQGRIAFSFGNLAPGKVTLLILHNKGLWRANLTRRADDLVLRQERGRLSYISGAVDAAISETQVMRKVALHFQPPAGSPPYQGEVTLYNVNSDDVPKTAKVTDNVLTFDAAVGSTFNVYASGATGYIFDSIRRNVVAEDGPLQIDIPMKPAGAVSGMIQWDVPDAERARHTEAVLLVQRQSKTGDISEWDTINNEAGSLFRVLDGGRRYFISPVSLNESYRVVLIGDNSFAESEVFRLEDHAPMARKDITFAGGERVSGQVLEPDGAAMRGGSVKLLYVIEGLSFQRWIDTDADGTFVLPQLNPNMAGSCYITVPSTEGRTTLTEQITPGATTLRLQRQEAEILTGRITDSNGKGVAGIQASALMIDERTGKPLFLGEYADAPSNIEGRFRFSTLPKGTFRITLDAEDTKAKFKETVKDVRLTGQPGPQVEFTLIHP